MIELLWGIGYVVLASLGVVVGAYILARVVSRAILRSVDERRSRIDGEEQR